jgi:DNA-binding winged helix-turn-helix (wHTH) protein
MPVARFGPFELDLERCELRRGDALVKLQPQPYKVLRELVARRGALVTRDQLRAVVWGDDNHVDFNAGLNFCIAQLRVALDDPASRSAIIRAVPRLGYKLAAPVTDVGPAGEKPASVPTMPNPVEARGRRPVMWAGIAAAAVACAALALPLTDALRWLPGYGARHSVAAIAKFERGNSGLADAGPSELLARVKHFEKAIELDSRFAEAYVGLADAKLIIGTYRVEAPQMAYSQAKAAGLKALSIDPRLGDAHAVYGAALLQFDWDWASAAWHLERAVALSPDSARAHRWYSRYLSAAGKHDAALRHATRAVQLAPASASAHTDLGTAAFYAGDFDQAVASCAKAEAMLPEFVPARICIGLAEVQAGRRSASPNQAGVVSAVAFAQVGDRSRALDSLELAANHHTDWLVFAGVHPAFAPLRSDPRFQNVLQRVGAPEGQRPGAGGQRPQH